MGDNEQHDPVQAKLDLLLDRFQDLSNRLTVQSVQLFGSVEDSFTAGHLPMLKKEVAALDGRVVAIEQVHAKESGATSVLGPFLKWLSGIAAFAAGSFMTWYLTRPR